jgi:hypothetical protein
MLYVRCIFIRLAKELSISMGKKNIQNNPAHILSAADLVKSFGVIIALTAQGELVSRPLGGEWENGICEAVEEVANAYPGCKIKLFTNNYEPKYWRGIIPSDRILA